jgi:hypothetical protein
VNVIRHSPNGMPLGFVQGHLPKPPPPVVELSELEEINKVVELASDSRETIKKLKQILQELAQDGWAWIVCISHVRIKDPNALPISRQSSRAPFCWGWSMLFHQISPGDES